MHVYLKMIWKTFIALSLLVIICEAGGIPPPRPGKCKKTTFVTVCNFCKGDYTCGAGEKCCGGCCSSDIINVTCTDKRGVVVGDCVLPMYCPSPKVISTKFKCPTFWRKKGCKCCVPPPQRPPKRGKCPHWPPPINCLVGCQNDYDCKGPLKCCHNCCTMPRECSNKGRWGLCEHKKSCRWPYVIIGKCPKVPREKRCVCCAPPLRPTPPAPTTTPAPTTPPMPTTPALDCTATWAGRNWTGLCIPKPLCRKPSRYRVKCPLAAFQCPLGMTCCFTKKNQPNRNACWLNK